MFFLSREKKAYQLQDNIIVFSSRLGGIDRKGSTD